MLFLVVFAFFVGTQSVPLSPSIFNASIPVSSRNVLRNTQLKKRDLASRNPSSPSMRDFDGWTRNAWSAQCQMQATILLPGLPTPVAADAVIKVDPVAKYWYFNGGSFGVQWITESSAFTVQETPNGPVCWEIQGWNFTQQVKGYQLAYENEVSGAISTFSGGAHDVTSCGCVTAVNFDFFQIGGQYRLSKFAISQAYPYLPAGARGVKINLSCPPSGAGGSGPTAAEMTLPAICSAPYLQTSYCDVFTPPTCDFVPFF
jgi:hypothetical protein